MFCDLSEIPHHYHEHQSQPSPLSHRSFFDNLRELNGQMREFDVSDPIFIMYCQNDRSLYISSCIHIFKYTPKSSNQGENSFPNP